MRRVTALAVCLLVVSGMVLAGVGPGGSMVGTAAADDALAIDAVNCSFTDYMFAPVSLAVPDGCSLQIQSVNTTDQGNLDNYAMAVSVQDNAEGYRTSHSNRLEDTKSVAWSKAKIAAVEAMNDGKSEAEAQVAAKQAVQSYYSTMEYNTVQQWNTYVDQISYVNASSVDVRGYHTSGSTSGPADIGNVSNTTYTLLNGTDVQMREFYHSGDGGVWVSLHDAETPTNDATVHVEVDDPTQDGGQWEDILMPKPWGTLTDDMVSQSNTVQSNIDAYISSVYTEYTEGELNASDAIDPQTLAQEASTNYNSTGYYGYAAANLAALGYSGNLSASHTVEVYNSTGTTVANYSGTLFYTGDDVDRFNTSQNYTFSNLSGTVYMAVQSGEKASIRDLSEDGSEMRITEATNTKTKESLNATKIETKTYSTHNASNLQSELDQLQELRQDIQEMQAGGGVGGGGGAGNPALIVGLIAVVLLLAYVGRGS